MRGFAIRAIPNLVVFMTGLAIMVLELVASRLVARHLGSSLETWTTVIAVILAGMSLGNYWGGRLSDERDPLRTLPFLVGFSALLCLSVLLTNDLVGGSALMARLPGALRVIATICIVFLPPSCALGTIQPSVARWAIRQTTRAGTAFGNIGAWNTAGNILGTFLTGFVLLTSFGVRSIVVTSVLILAVLAVGLWCLSSFWPDEASPEQALTRQPRGETDKQENRGWALALPNLFVFISGMSIMMMELVGGRMLSRATGSSIYTWTSLIGVVLAGLTVGNYVGGRLADRFNPSRALPHLFLMASMFCSFLLMADGLLESPSIGSDFVHKLLVPETGSGEDSSGHSLATWVLPATIFTSVFLVFMAPSCSLGMISPMVAKLALERAEKAGLALGNVYAWGTVGSIAGSFLTGFVLISLLGTKVVICVIAGILALVAVCMSTSGLFHAIWAGVLLSVALAVAVPEKYEMITGLAFRLKLRERIPEGETHDESNYYHIKVQPSRDAVELVLDNLIHGYVLEGHPRELRYDYELIYASIMERSGAIPIAEDSAEAAALHIKPRAIRTLFLGGGSYTYPRYIEACYPGSTMLVAEIDPAVTRMAHRALFLPQDTPIETRWGDARATIDRMLAAQTTPFDYIFGDAFNDFSVPWHLTTLEFNEKIKRLLAPEGVYMINIIDNFKHAKFLGAYVQTARKTFPSVAVFCTAEGGPSEQRETFVIAMSQANLDYADLGTRHRERPFQGTMLTEKDVELAIQRSGEILLTDDYAPVENLLAPVARER